MVTLLPVESSICRSSLKRIKLIPSGIVRNTPNMDRLFCPAVLNSAANTPEALVFNGQLRIVHCPLGRSVAICNSYFIFISASADTPPLLFVVPPGYSCRQTTCKRLEKYTIEGTESGIGCSGASIFSHWLHEAGFRILELLPRSVLSTRRQ